MSSPEDLRQITENTLHSLIADESLKYRILQKAASSETIRSDKSVAWTNILELLFDDEAKDFARSASEAGIPAPEEENIGYEVDGPDGQVIATVEIAWPDRKIGFLTTEQLSDREHLEQNGWTIIDMLTIDESAQLFSD